VRLVIADDQPVVRAGLRMLLEGEPGFEVVAETADIASTVRELGSRRVDALVIDTHIPGELGVASVPELVQASPDTAVIILTMQDDPSVVREALRAGARGYVLKHSAGIELIDAVRAAVAGETYLNPILGARMATGPPATDRRLDGLTERETEVLRLIALGYTNTEIAHQLYLSVRTVESHRAHIQQKLRLSTRAALVRYALDHDLIDR
jgi:two-component system, NarL family, response regulator NreC